MGLFFRREYKYATPENLNEKEITDKFKQFIIKIKGILCKKNDYEKFNNPFFKIQDGLRLYNYYSEELLDYLKIDDDRKRFYFAQPYISCIVIIVNC